MDAGGKKRTAIYARSSTNVRTTKTQLDTCRAAAAQLELDVLHEFIDENISGAVPFQSRPGGRELLAALPEIDAVLLYRIDRLSRSATDLKELVQVLDASKVELWSVADLPLPARIVTAQVTEIASFAETERAAISRRMNSGVRRAAVDGKWLGGPIPFGYDLDSNGALTPSLRLVAGMTEAELARSVFERLAAGSSTVREARRMNDLGVFPGRRYSHKVVTMRRAIWFPSRVNAMVRNPLYKGTHCVESAGGAIERRVAALVSTDLWQAAQDRLRANRSCEPGRPTNPHLLRGLMFCDDCGFRFAVTRVTSRTNNWVGLYYRCSGQIGVVEPDPELRCRAKMIRADSIEELVWKDCLRIDGSAEAANDFWTRRPIVEKWVRRIGVRTLSTSSPKVALVRVDYANDEQRTFRFARGDGVAL